MPRFVAESPGATRPCIGVTAVRPCSTGTGTCRRDRVREFSGTDQRWFVALIVGFVDQLSKGLKSLAFPSRAGEQSF